MGSGHKVLTPSTLPSLDASTLATSSRGHDFHFGRGCGRDSRKGRDRGCNDRSCVHYGRINYFSYRCWQKFDKSPMANQVHSDNRETFASTIVPSEHNCLLQHSYLYATHVPASSQISTLVESSIVALSTSSSPWIINFDATSHMTGSFYKEDNW